MQVSINSFTLLSYQCGGVALSLICLIAVRVDIQLGQIRSLRITESELSNLWLTLSGP